MDNEQLLQQIGGMFGQVNKQMEELASRVDKQIGQLSNRVDEQIGQLSSRVDKQIGQLTGQIGQLSQRMDAMETRLNQRMDTLESQLTERMDGIDGRLGRVEETLTRVAVTQENVVLPALKQLAEGHEELTRQIGVVSTQVERNTETIELHTVQIAGLQEKVKALA